MGQLEPLSAYATLVATPESLEDPDYQVSSPRMLRTGSQLQHGKVLEVVEPLGEGGMGMVYAGEHVATGQKVAIKALHPSLVENQAARDRFIREGQALARLNHPNIIGLRNLTAGPDGLLLIMEYAEGEDLEQLLQTRGLLPAEVCLPWFAQVCDALHFAHGNRDEVSLANGIQQAQELRRIGRADDT